MSSDYKCETSLVLGEDKNILTNLQNSMLSVGQQIVDQTDNLYTKNNNIYNTMQQNSVQFYKDVNMYKANDNKIKSELNLPGRFQTETKSKSNSNVNINKREGMRTIDPSANSEKILTMNDINSMLSDTDIRVLQENYSYIFWSILAVGLLTITVNQIKK
jgi:2,4-dienoyl-CoA reductase-like NADH-dependent reductase (Old Yellow Enzyme family)